MLRYERDDHAQEHPSDDINVNTVTTWRLRCDAAGRVASLVVDLHNGWCFDLDHWRGESDVPVRLPRALRDR